MPAPYAGDVLAVGQCTSLQTIATAGELFCNSHRQPHFDYDMTFQKDDLLYITTFYLPNIDSHVIEYFYLLHRNYHDNTIRLIIIAGHPHSPAPRHTISRHYFIESIESPVRTTVAYLSRPICAFSRRHHDASQSYATCTMTSLCYCSYAALMESIYQHKTYIAWL